MKNKVIKHTGLNVQAGQEPIADRIDTRGVLSLRPWQKRAFAALRGKPLRILLSPTGAGKSSLIKAIANDELLNNPSLRVVIAVPQGIIARSFGKASLRVDGRVVRWSVGHNMIDTTGSVNALIDFLKAKPGSTMESRIMVVTHAALVAAHRKMMRAKPKKSPWRGASLYVDEAHHSRSQTDDDDGSDDDAETFNNRLGQLVAHWIDAKPGPLLLATATWLRANLLDIVPSNRMDDFAKFVLTMEDHLRAMNHLREVSFRFLIGSPEDALRELANESNEKTIVYLPHVASAHVRKKGGKAETLKSYMAAFGDVVGRDEWTTKLKLGRRTRRALDFVTVDGRDARKAAFEAAIPLGSKHTPDVLFTLNLAKEGFDWPEASVAHVVGARGSIPDTLQMMGRVMRDHPGKSRAVFNVILPYASTDDVDQVRGYMNAILASMVLECQFVGRWPWRKADREERGPVPVEKESGQKTRCYRADDDSNVDQQKQAVAVVNGVKERVIRDPKAMDDPDRTIREVLREEGIKTEPKEEKKIVAEVRGWFAAKTRAMLKEMSDLNVGVDVTESDFGCIRMLAMTFGYKTLADLREAMGAREAPIPREEMRAKIQGMSKDEYESMRKETGDICASHFPAVYGETFRQLRDSRRMILNEHGRMVLDLSGTPCGDLTVVEYAGQKNGRSMWRCACNCGRKDVIVVGSALTNGNTKSCGHRGNTSAVEARKNAGRKYVVAGRPLSVLQMASVANVDRTVIKARLYRGWTPEEAIAGKRSAA